MSGNLSLEGLVKIRAETGDDGQVLNLTLNAPPGNVLDREMIGELTRTIEDQASEVRLKLLVLRGEGDQFSFGASVPEHRREQVGEMLTAFHGLFRTLIAASVPCVAVVRGQCLGGGLELASFCHWVFAAEGARFGQPEIQLAVFPPAGSLILPYRIGQSASDHLVLGGDSISATTAKALGLVHAVSADPEAELREFIERQILPRSACALKIAARASRHEMYEAFLTHISALEELYLQDLMATRDANEGIEAFLEKRRPVWQHR